MPTAAWSSTISECPSMASSCGSFLKEEGKRMEDGRITKEEGVRLSRRMEGGRMEVRLPSQLRPR